jgi:predicted phosphodiesterase
VEAKRLGIAREQTICTGDLTAYCGDPAATIDLIRASGIAVVMGNCDEQLALGAGDCACGFTPGSACEQLSSSWFSYASTQVGVDARCWLAQLPRRIDLEFDGCLLTVVHGGVEKINQFVFASSSALIKQRNLQLAGCDGVIAGHCGLPFTQVVDGRLWHNAGVVGMPANDGTPRGWFSLITPIDGSLQIVDSRPDTWRWPTRCSNELQFAALHRLLVKGEGSPPFLECISPQLALSGGSQGGEFTSAFEGSSGSAWTDGPGPLRRN